MTDTREQATCTCGASAGSIHEPICDLLQPREQAAGAGEWRDRPMVTDEDVIEARADEIAELRAQLRHAWANLGCRCIFNADDTIQEVESHCPWHGWTLSATGLDDHSLVVPSLEHEIAELRAEVEATEQRALDWAGKCGFEKARANVADYLRAVARAALEDAPINAQEEA